MSFAGRPPGFLNRKYSPQRGNMINESAIAKANGAARRYSTTWPAVNLCTSCMAAQVGEGVEMCKTCIVKEAERRRYEAEYVQRRNNFMLWIAIAAIGAIVFGVNWYVAGR